MELWPLKEWLVLATNVAVDVIDWLALIPDTQALRTVRLGGLLGAERLFLGRHAAMRCKRREGRRMTGNAAGYPMRVL
jgi:hypothetical protein